MDGGTGSLLYLWRLTSVGWILSRWDNSHFSGIWGPCRYPASCESPVSRPGSPFPTPCQDHSTPPWLPSAAQHHTFQLNAAWAHWFQLTQLSLSHCLHRLQFFLPQASQCLKPPICGPKTHLPSFKSSWIWINLFEKTKWTVVSKLSPLHSPSRSL